MKNILFFVHTDEPPENHDELCKAFQYCQVRSRAIEVNYENMDGDKILTRVNFQVDPAVRGRERKGGRGEGEGGRGGERKGGGGRGEGERDGIGCGFTSE